MASPSFSDLLKEARSRLQALDTQIAENRKKEDVGVRLERLERSLAEVGTRVTTMATQVEGLGKTADALRKSQEIPADLRARLDKYENAIADLSRKIGGEKDTLVAYRQSVRQLVQATSSIKPGDFEGLREVVEKHLSQYPEREVRVRNLEGRMESLQTLEARLQDLEAAVRKSVEGFEERLKAVGKVGEELEKMKAGVVKEVGTAGAKVERLREQAERLEAQAREVPALVKKEVDGALVGALGELWTKMKALEGDVAKAQEATAAKPLEALLNTEKAKLRAAEEGLQALRGDVARGREDAAEMKSDLRALRDIPGRLKEFEILRGDFAEAKEETMDLKSDLKALRDIPGRLKEFEALRGDLARMKEETADMKALRDLPGRLKELEALFESAPRLRGVEARLAPLEVVARKLEERLVDWSVRFPELETKLKQVDEGFREQRQAAERISRGEARTDTLEQALRQVDADLQEQWGVAEKARLLESRLEALEKSVVGLAQRRPAGPSVEDLRRQRQSILALLDTLRSGYEQKLLGAEEYEAIARENRGKIAELDAKISEMGGA